MNITKHANDRMLRLAHVVGRSAIQSLIAKANTAPRHGDHAVVIELNHPVCDPHREQWEESDRLAGIVRNGRLVSVMLTRANQCNRAHLRVSAIHS